MDLQTALKRAALKTGCGIRFILATGGERYMPYPEVYETSLRVLGALQQAGLREGDELAIQTDDNAEFVPIFFACLLGRIVPVPLSCGVQTEQKQKLSRVWKQLSRPFLTCDEAQFERSAEFFEDREELSRCYFPIGELLASVTKGAIVAATPDQLAYIQFSSGSTGDPKGVCLTHDNLATNIQDIIRSLEITDADLLLSWMPLTHDMGLIGFLLTGITQGISLVSIPTSVFVRRPLLWMEKASSCRASVLYSPNFGLQYFLSAFAGQEDPGWDLSGIRILVNGAESISAAVCERFVQALRPWGLRPHPIVAAYGMAEASVEVSASKPGTPLRQYWIRRDQVNIGESVAYLEEGEAGGVSFVDLGQPVSYCQLRVCDEEGALLKEDQIGHIQIKGRNVTSGYYNNMEATRSVFTEDGWLKTGDIGFLHAGRLVMTGRLKNIIILNGQNYYPKDIEDVLVANGIVEAGRSVACGIPLPDGREGLALFILHKGPQDQLQPLSTRAKSILLKEMGVQADYVFPVARFPKTTSGKVQNYKLVAQFREGAFDAYKSEQEAIVKGGASAEDLQQMVVDHASALLGLSGLQKDTNFIEAGMNSIVALQLANRLSQATGKQLSGGLLFQNPNAEQLAQILSGLPTPQALPPIVPTPRERVYALTPAQKRIWFECQFNKASVGYNVPVVYQVSGAFGESRFREAVRAAVKRHEILRTSFEQSEGEPYQKVHAYSDTLCFVRTIDLRAAANPEEEAAFFQRRDSNTPFQLEVPCQLRVTFLQLGESEYRIVFVIHHILTDGWSLRLLFGEICNDYNGAQELASPANPRLQYRDFAAWQSGLLSSGLMAVHQAYWSSELAAMPAPVNLPARSQGTHEQDVIRLEQSTHIFGREQLEKIGGLAAKYGASRFVIVEALCQLLLHRYTGQHDLVTAFDTTGRVTSESENLPGYMLNTLCLRINIQKDWQFDDLLRQVSGKVNSALDHQLYPFELVMDDLKASQPIARRPFEVLVIYHNFLTEAKLLLNGCSLQRLPAFVNEGFVNLLLDFTEGEDALELVVHYNEDLYERSFLERFAAHFELLLEAVWAGGTQALSSYEFVLPEERAELLLPSSNTDGYSQFPVHVLFEHMAVRCPDAIAVVAGETRVTYRQLSEQSNALAHYLKETWNVQPDDRVGFLLSRNETMIVAMLGILKSGAAYVAIDPQLPVSRCEHIVSDSGMKCLITDRANLPLISDHFDPAFLVQVEEASAGAGPDMPVHPHHAGKLAYVIYTSGTTGKPKGVLVEHASLTGYVQQFISYFDVTCEDVVIQQASVSFDVMVEEVYPALCTGARIVIAEEGGRNVYALLDLVAAHGVTILSSTPAVISLVNESMDSRISSLRVVISGGDVLHARDVDRLLRNLRVCNTYGPSEATVCATYNELSSPAQASFIGKPIAGRRIFILDENGQLLPKGCIGELYIEGGLARGYLNHDALTSEKFIVHPFMENSRLYRTGDLGRWREDGVLEFMGRIDSQVKIRGIRIELSEVEAAILNDPTVKAAVVVLHEDTVDNKRLVAFLCVKDDHSEAALRASLLQTLPAYMVPSLFVVLPSMPISGNGKTDRAALQARAQSGTLPLSKKEYVEPVSRHEKVLHGIWTELLRQPRLGITDDFFEAGGHSLKANQLANKIFQSLGVDVSLSKLFTHTTIRQQAELIEGLEQKKFKFIELP